MKICPVCSARCFEDMEICFGCMHRFDAQRHDPFELSLPQEISLQDISILPRMLQPYHAALPNTNKDKAASQTVLDTSRAKPAQEGFQAEYQLIISLRPTTRNTALQVDDLRVNHA